MTERTCFRCKETKPLTEYWRSNVDYYQRECKACTKARKAGWWRTPEGKRCSANTKLKSRFGVTMEQYESMLEKVGGKCEICGAKPEENTMSHRIGIDHCHDTGAIRGLLCKPCNTGIAAFKDDEQILLNAIQYLRDRQFLKSKGAA